MMKLPRFGAIAFLLASLLCAVALAACAPGQATLKSVKEEQTLQSISPNIAALHAAGNGLLEMPAFVEFYSNDCAICRRIQGSMRALDLQYEGRVKFVYVDIDLPESQPFVRGYNVRGIPEFVLLNRHGDMVRSLPGWPGEDTVAGALDDLLKQQ